MAGIAILAGFANRDRIRLKIASVYASVPPKAAQGGSVSTQHSRAFRGDAPWALSALPECFSQLSKYTSPTLAYVAAHIPKDVTPVRAPSTLRYADCTVRVAGRTVYVDRGDDRLRIPPPVRLYVGGNRHLALLRKTQTGYELRVYEPVSGGAL